ncbi:MAG: hypothetical protein HKN12_06225 [Gemmatimonadetes bacterium]|nr:hypothetical protein [Gemmatimonadota bacterium]
MKKTALAAMLALLIAAPAQAGISIPVCPPSWTGKLLAKQSLIRFSCAVDAGGAVAQRVPIPGVKVPPDRAKKDRAARTSLPAAVAPDRAARTSLPAAVAPEPRR